MEMFGLPLGIAAIVAVLVTNRPATFGIVSLCVAVAFVGLWVATNPAPCGDIGTEVQLRMCAQSHSVWGAYRMLLIGLPGLVVFIVWGFKFEQMVRDLIAVRRSANPSK